MKKWAALILVLGLAGWNIWPIIKNPATAFAWGGDDGLITWYLNDTIQKIPGDLKNLWQGNIFYPYKYTRAFGVMLIPSALLVALPTKIIGTHVAAYNLTIILAQFLTAIFLWKWFCELSDDPLAAAVGTVVFLFSQIKMSFVVHIHFWVMQWLVLGAWMVWKYAKDGRVWQLYVAGAALAIQFWESIYQAYWIALWIGIWLWVKRKKLIGDWKHWLVILVGVGVLVSPVVYVYAQVYREWGYAGSIREAAHFSASLNDLWGMNANPGMYVLLAALVLSTKGEVLRVRGTRWLVALLIFGVVMALGPVLKWQGETVKIWDRFFVPLPYGLFHYLIPGFSSLRSVHRWLWVAGLAASGLVAVGLSWRRGVYWLGLLGVLIVGIVGGDRVRARGNFQRPEDYPTVYTWLRDAPGKVILEYPVYNWADKHFDQEMFRMTYSLKHRKKLVGGAFGFLPKERGELLGKIQVEYPSVELNRILKDMGVNYVVVHKSECLMINVQCSMGGKILWEDENDVVYELVL